jgi:hypothetical protein
MWSRIDDALADHRKVIAAAEIIGPDGIVIALGFYLLGLTWSNKHLTDGHLPAAVVKHFRSDRPIELADAMVRSGLWDRAEDGYRIHDFEHLNFTAAEVKEKRDKDRRRKHNGRA